MTTILMAGGGTGGHLFPAIAIANAVQVAHPDWQVAFAGATRGIEANVLPGRQLQHRLFPFEPLHRKQWWRNARWPFLGVGLIREIDRWLRELAPDAVVGTGGYVSAPVVWRAAARGIPTAILELDVRPGIATRLVARRTREIWLGAPEALPLLPPSVRDKVRVTGAPITPPEHSRAPAARSMFALDSEVPTIVITGGSQGSLALNRVVASWLDAGGARDRQVIWATGRNLFDGFATYGDVPKVHVTPFLDPIADAWSVAQLAIARAGMMTLAELAAWGIPAILVPLPTAAADHQTHNARAVSDAGAGVLLPQGELTTARLESEVAALLNDRGRLATMRERALERGRPGAAEEIAARVAELVVDRR
jgi:UDP-N-acetylglucosamine--N-acetylmuramyl-(pentapeptide) pyrophosphoryl-undecaprenol N-acetylglucosamine transferase